MTSKKLLIAVLALGMIAFGLGLGSNWQPVIVSADEEHGDEGHASNEVTLEILMGEFFFQVEGQEPGSQIVLDAGVKYSIKFENQGAIEHEAMFGNGLNEEHPGEFHGYLFNLFEDVEVEFKGEINGETFRIEAANLNEIELMPGQSLIVEFTLPESKRGIWEIGCFVAGHYEAGMNAFLIVE